MTQDSPPLAAFMNRFEAELRARGIGEWREIARDVRNHIGEAQSQGRALDDAIAALGPPETLARSYAAELLMHPQETPAMTSARFFKLTGLVLAGGAVSALVVGVLGMFSLFFVLGGGAMFILGVLKSTNLMPGDVKFRILCNGVSCMGDLSPMDAVMMGAVSLVIGALLIRLLWFYVRGLTRTLASALPPGAPRPA